MAVSVIQLKDVIRDHVAKCPSVLVVATAKFDTELLGNRHLHVIHIAAVPNRLEYPIREARKAKNILDGFFSQDNDRCDRPDSPCTTLLMSRFNCLADSRSWPNGFSITTRFHFAIGFLGRSSGAELVCDRRKEQLGSWRDRETEHSPGFPAPFPDL